MLATRTTAAAAGGVTKQVEREDDGERPLDQEVVPGNPPHDRDHVRGAASSVRLGDPLHRALADAGIEQGHGVQVDRQVEAELRELCGVQNPDRHRGDDQGQRQIQPGCDERPERSAYCGRLGGVVIEVRRLAHQGDPGAAGGRMAREGVRRRRMRSSCGVVSSAPWGSGARARDSGWVRGSAHHPALVGGRTPAFGQTVRHQEVSPGLSHAHSGDLESSHRRGGRSRGSTCHAQLDVREVTMVQVDRPGSGLELTSGHRPYRIALVSASFHPYAGGVEEHTRQVAHSLSQRGHEVEVWTVDQGERLGSRVVDGLLVRYLPTPLPARSATAMVRFAAQAPLAAARWWRAHTGASTRTCCRCTASGPMACTPTGWREQLGRPWWSAATARRSWTTRTSSSAPR